MQEACGVVVPHLLTEGVWGCHTVLHKGLCHGISHQLCHGSSCCRREGWGPHHHTLLLLRVSGGKLPPWQWQWQRQRQWRWWWWRWWWWRWWWLQ